MPRPLQAADATCNYRYNRVAVQAKSLLKDSLLRCEDTEGV